MLDKIYVIFTALYIGYVIQIYFYIKNKTRLLVNLVNLG